MSEQVQTNGLEDQAPSISDFQINVNGEIFTLGQLASSQAAAQLLYIAFQQQADHAEADKREAVQAVHNELFQYAQEAQQYREQLSQSEFRAKDAESKRDAAVKELEEVQAVLAQVKSHRDDLQAQIAVGVRGAINIVNAGDAVEQFKAQLKQEQESKPAIYDVMPLDQRKSRYGATLLNGDYVEIPYLELGKYRQIKPEEVETELARFRAEQDQTSVADSQTDDHADSALVEPIAPPQLEGGTFQGDSMEDVHAEPGVVDQQFGVEGHGTVEERLAALEARVSWLEVLAVKQPE